VVDEPAAVGADTAPAERYEQLRQLVLGGHAEGWRHGLGMLTGKGLAGWMRAWTGSSQPPAATAPAAPAAPSPAGPAGTRAGEVVAVLAQMALAHT
jgi:hypothetical protein